MGQKEVDKLRSLIRTRARLLKQLKTASAKRKLTIEIELLSVNTAIKQLDEKQR